MATSTPERLPLAIRSRRNVKRIATDGMLFDFLNYSARDMVRYETDFFGGAVDALLTTGGAGTAAALVSGGLGGTVALVTGAVDNQCSTLYLANKSVQGNQNPVIAVRLQVDSIATGNVQIGFTDSNAAGIIGATGVGPFVSPLASPPTLTGATADAIAFTYDLSSALGTPASWRVAYARSSTAALFTPATTLPAAIVAPVAATYQWLTLALERTNVATPNMGFKAYINDVLVGSLNLGAISNAVALFPFVLVGATSGASRTLTLDYLGVWQDRDTSA